MSVTIVAQQGSHLLIANQNHYAVIERREDRYYSCHDASRAGIPVNALSDIETILDASDWTDRGSAQTAFDAVTRRGTELAQRML